MRIIAGQAKGHHLKVPREVSRPTTDRVRESLFGILSPVVSGARVLDLFAGSGALGLEALSRGAAECLFVERDRGACRVIEENLKKTGLTGGQVRCGEVARFLKGRVGPFDLILADPPYADGLSDPAAALSRLTVWRDCLAEGGILVLEEDATGQVLEFVGLTFWQSREYGRSRISFYRREDPS